MSPDWDLIYHIMTSLYLALSPGVLCFGYKTLQNVCIQQHYSLISEMFSNVLIAQANTNKQRRKVSRRELYLTNRFHFAVRLYSDNAQMTSKRGVNKEVRYEPQASSVTDVLTTF